MSGPLGHSQILGMARSLPRDNGFSGLLEEYLSTLPSL